jgi:hypothetical protein
VKYDFVDEDLRVRYIMSLRWALSQYAGGMDEVTPQNFSEHLYSSFVYLITFWAGAVFLGMLTSNMTQLYILSSQQAHQISAIKRYLRQNSITKGLAVRVIRNAQNIFESRKKQIPEGTLGMQDLVSIPLLVELHFEMHFPFLSLHPFFHAFAGDNVHVLRRICHSAMSTTFNSVGDVLFHSGETADHMIFIKAGLMQYSCRQAQDVVLGTSSWLSEPPLWTQWTYRGVLIVTEDSRCFKLHAADFHQIVQNFEICNFDPAGYAKSFVVLLNETPADMVSDLPLAGHDGIGALVRADRKGRSKSTKKSVMTGMYSRFAEKAHSGMVQSRGVVPDPEPR